MYSVLLMSELCPKVPGRGHFGPTNYLWTEETPDTKVGRYGELFCVEKV
jgi:hypothetical protein